MTGVATATYAIDWTNWYRWVFGAMARMPRYQCEEDLNVSSPAASPIWTFALRHALARITGGLEVGRANSQRAARRGGGVFTPYAR